MSNLEEYKDSLRQAAREMFDLCRRQLETAGDAFLEFDTDLAEEVMRTENRVNALDLKIDRDCERFIALYTPVARDLRFALALRKINFDLERIGDHAYGMAYFVASLDEQITEDKLERVEFRPMFEGAMSMLEDVSISFNEGDTTLARQVFKKDKELNRINQQTVKVISAALKEDPKAAEHYLLLFSVIKKLERIGDLVTNIAEEIIFYRKAEVIKHKKKKPTSAPE